MFSNNISIFFLFQYFVTLFQYFLTYQYSLTIFQFLSIYFTCHYFLRLFQCSWGGRLTKHPDLLNPATRFPPSTLCPIAQPFAAQQNPENPNITFVFIRQRASNCASTEIGVYISAATTYELQHFSCGCRSVIKPKHIAFPCWMWWRDERESMYHLHI